jgi:hypothetical protein
LNPPYSEPSPDERHSADIGEARGGHIRGHHRSMKNQILLENYYLPGQLEQLSLLKIPSEAEFERLRESVSNRRS